MALALARRIKAALEARLGARILLTRDGDAAVPLDARASLANNNKADLFVSIHANGSVRPSAAGAEVFYAGVERYAADGQRLGRVRRHADAGLRRRHARDRHRAVGQRAVCTTSSESAAAARLFEATLRQAVPMNLRALQQAPLRVLVGANMPAVLVEVGYLTNAEQEDAAAQRRVPGPRRAGDRRGHRPLRRAGTRALCRRCRARRDDKARRTWTVVAVVALAVGLWWVLFIALPRWTAPKPATPPPPQVRTEPTAKIRARLFHLSEDGLRLQPVESEVPFGEGTLEQGRQLALALLQPRPRTVRLGDPAGHDAEGLLSQPRGRGVRGPQRRGEPRAPAASLDEIFTVYSIVNTLTDNLPAIAAVQLLVDGHQVDTLAGHVDVRRPLAKDLRWTELPQGEDAAAAAAVPVGIRHAGATVRTAAQLNRDNRQLTPNTPICPCALIPDSPTSSVRL